MLVSALLTSVGINFGICVGAFALYSFLGKQPGNVHVYRPRGIAEGVAVESRGLIDIERLIPSAGWLKRAWQTSEDELLSIAGFDAFIFMRIFVFSIRVFTIAGVIGLFGLLPINYLGKALSEADVADITSESLDLFTISNVQSGSSWLWAHFCAVYILTGATCFFLYLEYRYISTKRISYYLSSKAKPDQFTILVRSIPVSQGSSYDESVEKFFTEYHPSTYLSHNVVRRTSKIRGLIRDVEKAYQRVTWLNSSSPDDQSLRRRGFLGLFVRRNNEVDHHKKRLEDLEENVRLEQTEVSVRGEELSAAFVCFKSRYGAAIANNLQQSTDPTQWVTEQAPEPRDVYWPFLFVSFLSTWMSKMVVIVASLGLTALFLIPVVFVQGLSNLDQLEVLFPFLASILSITIVSEVITGYLPSLILQLFLMIVPPIMKLLSSMQGFISNSEIERSACRKVLWFTIWNIFFANVLSGSVASQISVLFDPKDIPARLAVAVPAQASFFIAYVVTSGWTGSALELMRAVPLINDVFQRHIMRVTYKNFHAPPIRFHSVIPKVLFFGLLGITYFFLAPLILPFLLGYLCLGYLIYRNQLLNVYMPIYDTGGKLWPIVHHTTIFSLILSHAIAIGIFALKKLSLASSLMIPLPILTIIFNEYCRKRFLPIFKAYPAETMLKKERQEQNDPAMAEFFDSLETAYRDPALLPVSYSLQANDDKKVPLLSSDV